MSAGTDTLTNGSSVEPLRPGAATAVRSLRERKKERQRTDLLRVGAELFRKNGYDQTRMEDIAAQAEVSPKTIYNYFPSKEKLLVALLDSDRMQQREAYERVVRSPPKDPAEALARLILADVGDVSSDGDKRLWRELLAAATRGHDRANDDFDLNRQMFTTYIERLIRHFVATGALATSLPVRMAAEVIYAVNAYDFREYCAAEHMTQENLLARARKQMRVLLNSWRE
jgi:AcrR family transcriptional regulator